MLEDQTELLADEMAHWMELFDEDLQSADVKISQRPLQALIKLLLSGGIELRYGDQDVDLSQPSDHPREVWFKALYAAVERWYVKTYGAERVTGKRRTSSKLRGAALIRGEAYILVLPTNRTKVEVEGEQAWMFFEEGLGDGEDPATWIQHAPPLDGLDADQRATLQSQLEAVASTLRYVEFRRITADRTRDPEAQKLVQSTLIYLQQAASRMASEDVSERGPAWFDLQMANESALKAVIRQTTDAHPHIHALDRLLDLATGHGVSFDASRLAAWPTFSEISDYRYLQGDPGPLPDLYAAYILTLDLIRAAMAVMKPGLPSGFSVLLQYPPWLAKPIGEVPSAKHPA